MQNRRVNADAPAPIQTGPGYGTGCFEHQWHRAGDKACFACGVPKTIPRETLPDDTQLSVILMDELRPGDVVIVNLKEKLSSCDQHVQLMSQFSEMFPNQKIILNDDRASFEIVRPGEERRAVVNSGT